MISTLYSMGINGIEAFKVQIECDVSSGGIPMCEIVGLPDTAVKEAKNRVRSAINSCGFKFPISRITINLAPADIKKSGSFYDLPIFIAILEASGQIDNIFKDSVFIGELSLSGNVCAVNGILSMVEKAKTLGFKNIFVPYANKIEAAVIHDINVYAIKNVSEIIESIKNPNSLKPEQKISIKKFKRQNSLDFSEIKGQYAAKRAIEIAIAGGHNVLMIGPPGSGKSMLAKHTVSILPEMTFEEILKTTSIHSIAGQTSAEQPLITERPFRSPHYSTSVSGITGGGANPKPGELSLAHNGILFLDEFPEFSRPVIESLRQPIEDNIITISRAKGSVTYPCSFMLIVAMNPCPCGYLGHPTKKCFCSVQNIKKYLSRISGPILDRIDIYIDVPPITFNEFNAPSEDNEKSETILARINNARKIQNERYAKYNNVFSNAKASSATLLKYCNLDNTSKILLKNAFDKMNLSARGYNKVLKIARTIADLENKEQINVSHITEALQYRTLNKKYNSFIK